MAYTIKAPAKINLGLDVISRRFDGYHDLKMIMQTINLFDILTFDINNSNDITLTCSNPDLETDENNLVIKVMKQICEEFNIRTGITVHLEKNIPIAAGMAGGSTDAAATFIALNDIFSLGLSQTELMQRAVTLGADIPYCIMQGTALSEGIGDILSTLHSIKGVTLVIAKPPIDVSTGFVYTNLKLTNEISHPDIDAISNAMFKNDIPLFASLLENILETVTIPAYPIIADIKQTLLASGALGALMSGSGPTVFGVFDNDETAVQACSECMKLCDNMFCRVSEFYSPK